MTTESNLPEFTEESIARAVRTFERAVEITKLAAGFEKLREFPLINEGTLQEIKDFVVKHVIAAYDKENWESIPPWTKPG